MCTAENLVLAGTSLEFSNVTQQKKYIIIIIIIIIIIMEAVLGKHSIDSLQKTAVLGTLHIIRKVLQCEA